MGLAHVCLTDVYVSLVCDYGGKCVATELNKGLACSTDCQMFVF